MQPGGGPTRDRVVADFDASLDRLIFFKEFQEASAMSRVTAVAVSQAQRVQIWNPLKNCPFGDVIAIANPGAASTGKG